MIFDKRFGSKQVIYLKVDLIIASIVLRCNTCGGMFSDPAWHLPIKTVSLRTWKVEPRRGRCQQQPEGHG